jgi:hypothetical protein
VQDFIAQTQSADFNGTQALDMLHRLNTIDYSSRQAGSSAADNTEKYYPLFYLDFISIVNGNFFDHVTITFNDWQARAVPWRSTISRCRST